MKKILISFLMSFAVFSSQVNAYTEADKFEISVKDTAQVGEKLDISIKAVTNDGMIVENYSGYVLMAVDDDSRPTLPCPDEGCVFSMEDQGYKFFSGALSFSKRGIMRVIAMDSGNTKIEGESQKIKVSAPDARASATYHGFSEKDTTNIAQKISKMSEERLKQILSKIQSIQKKNPKSISEKPKLFAQINDLVAMINDEINWRSIDKK